MKVGLLTWIDAENYGTCLQAYALQRVISALGHDCVIIDFRSQVRKDESRDNKKHLNIVFRKCIDYTLFKIKKSFIIASSQENVKNITNLGQSW